MFEEREEDILQQSDLFPNLVDQEYIKAYGLFVESLSHLRKILNCDFILRDYSLAKNYTILRIDKRHLENMDPSLLTHELEDEEDLEGWISFRYYYDPETGLEYETGENLIGFGIFDHDHDHDHEDGEPEEDWEE